jgi:hypothetical protein
MNYLVEMHDEVGAKVYNFRSKTPMNALSELADYGSKNGLYPFITATCYNGQKIVWEVEIKI